MNLWKKKWIGSFMELRGKFGKKSLITPKGTLVVAWLFTGFYREPEVNRRKEAWRLLSSFKPSNHNGWYVMGDFNEIVSNETKVGYRPRNEQYVVNFREVLEGDLFDLG